MVGRKKIIFDENESKFILDYFKDKNNKRK
jgi:hypothetical protein